MAVEETIRVRFAPSPTGTLHIGNARTALFNFLFARKNQGVFILRIEDTDIKRSEREYEENLIEDLKWLGIIWDEGPDVGGLFGPYRQSERKEIYESYLDRLRSKGLIYPCYCSEDELKREREEQLARGLPPRYSGKCRSLTEKERASLEKEGRIPSWRFRIEGGEIAFKDIIKGEMHFNTSLMGDFIVLRSTGHPSYNFAVVVDDIEMQVTHVIRGEDHLSNTPRQILLYNAFDAKPPLFAHHSLLFGPDGTKLSKRHGATSVKEFREKGILPEALCNYLALIGGSFEPGKEVYNLSELIKVFDLKKAGKSSAMFDEKKLEWINSRHIRMTSPDKLLEMARPFILRAGIDLNTRSLAWQIKMIESIRDNISYLQDVPKFIDFLFAEKVSYDKKASELLLRSESKEVLNRILPLLDKLPDSYEKRVEFWINLPKRLNLKIGKVYLPLRAAITGSLIGGELVKILSLLEGSELKKRIEEVI